MQRTLQRLSLLFLAAVLSHALLGCVVDDSDSDDEPSADACEDRNWREESPDTISCPLTESCVCGEGSVCCAQTKSQNDLTIVSASCTPLSQCSAIALACDGPEDCDSGEVCCAQGLSAECVPEQQCFGVQVTVFCHSNSDCPRTQPTCQPGDSDSYARSTIGFCVL